MIIKNCPFIYVCPSNFGIGWLPRKYNSGIYYQNHPRLTFWTIHKHPAILPLTSIFDIFPLVVLSGLFIIYIILVTSITTLIMFILLERIIWLMAMEIMLWFSPTFLNRKNYFLKISRSYSLALIHLTFHTTTGGDHYWWKNAPLV